MPFNPLSITSSPNMGSINMPKLLRTLRFKTKNVRNFIFHRDAIYERDVGTVKDVDGSPGDGTGRSTAISGPLVSFGYETNQNTTRVEATDRAYHVRVDETNIMGLTGLITPITTTSSNLERTGYRNQGSCEIYIPTVAQLTATSEDGYLNDDPLMGGSEFGYTIEGGFKPVGGNSYFDRFEPRDELIDMERITHNPIDKLSQTSGSLTYTLYTQTDSELINRYYTNGMTRLQFKIKGTTTSPPTLSYVQLLGTDSTASSDTVSLKWTFSTGLSVPRGDDLGASRHEVLTVDLPLIHPNGDNIKTGDTYTFQTRGGAVTATAAVVDGAYNNNNEFELNKLIGDGNFDGANEINKLKLHFGGGTVGAYDLTDIIFYESAHWVIDAIQEYRDEYIKFSCSKYRGRSPSHRRAHG